VKRKQIISLVLMLSILLTMAIGCGSSAKTTSNPPSTPTVQQSTVVPPTTSQPTTVTPTAQPTTTQTTTVAPTTQTTQPATKPATTNVAQPVQTNTQSQTVYTTNTGSKYHSAGCRYLAKSCIPITLANAKASGLGPCSVCNPPR